MDLRWQVVVLVDNVVSDRARLALARCAFGCTPRLLRHPRTIQHIERPLDGIHVRNTWTERLIQQLARTSVLMWSLLHLLTVGLLPLRACWLHRRPMVHVLMHKLIDNTALRLRVVVRVDDLAARVDRVLLEIVNYVLEIVLEVLLKLLLDLPLLVDALLQLSSTLRGAHLLGDARHASRSRSVGAPQQLLTLGTIGESRRATRIRLLDLIPELHWLMVGRAQCGLQSALVPPRQDIIFRFLDRYSLPLAALGGRSQLERLHEQ